MSSASSHISIAELIPLMRRRFSAPDDITVDSQVAPDIEIPEVPEKEFIAGDKRPTPESVRCSLCKENCKPAIPCSKCASTSYCSLYCLRKHKNEHKFHCRLGRGIDEADHLVQYCHQKCYPSEDEEVALAFGFLYFTRASDRIRLFELYCKLVNIRKVDDDELRQAWRTDQLRACIMRRCSQLPRHDISGDLQWFGSQIGFAANAETDFGPAVESAREVLGPTGLNALDSRQKWIAFLFYLQITNGYRHDSDEDNWLYLGFCAERVIK